MTYPRSVYHKDYDHLKGDSEKVGHEAYLNKKSKVAKDEAHHKAMGPDWYPGNHPHFASVKPVKVEDVTKVEKVDEVVEEVVVEEKPKSKWGK